MSQPSSDTVLIQVSAEALNTLRAGLVALYGEIANGERALEGLGPLLDLEGIDGLFHELEEVMQWQNDTSS